MVTTENLGNRPWNGSSWEEEVNAGLGGESMRGYGTGTERPDPERAREMAWGVEVEMPTNEESHELWRRTRSLDLEPGAEARAWSNWL